MENGLTGMDGRGTGYSWEKIWGMERVRNDRSWFNLGAP